MSARETITGSLTLMQRISGEISDPTRVSGDVQRAVTEQLPAYGGPYTVTPSTQTQTLSVSNMKMTDDITVEPIPSNYGLITWDGSVITVS